MASSSDHQTRSNFLSLPGELRIKIYRCLPVSSLIALNKVYNKTLHHDIQPFLFERAAMKISRQKGESGKASYKHELQSVDCLESATHLTIQNAIVYTPCEPGRRLRTFPAALEAFKDVLIHLRDTDIKRITVAISFPSLDFSSFEDSFDCVMDKFTQFRGSQSIIRRKLVICCSNIDRTGLYSEWHKITRHLEVRIVLDGILEAVEVWYPQPSLSLNPRAKPVFPNQERLWFQHLGRISGLYELRMGCFNNKQDKMSLFPEIEYHSASKVASLTKWYR